MQRKYRLPFQLLIWIRVFSSIFLVRTVSFDIVVCVCCVFFQWNGYAILAWMSSDDSPDHGIRGLCIAFRFGLILYLSLFVNIFFLSFRSSNDFFKKEKFNPLMLKFWASFTPLFSFPLFFPHRYDWIPPPLFSLAYSVVWVCLDHRHRDLPRNYERSE